MNKKLIILLLPILLVLTSCDLEQLLDMEKEYTEEEKIIQLAYSMDYLYPDGFYQEKHDGSIYYENTISMKLLSDNEIKWIELHTNDIERAKSFSEISNEYSSVNRKIISQRETEKFYEFTRINIQNENDILLSRIHKSNYFEPMLDKLKKADTIGIYNGELSADKVKEFVEYLFTNYSTGIYYSKVLHSHIKEMENCFQHIIRSLKVVYGDWGLYDQIYVQDHHFTLDKTEKILTVKSFEVEKIQGNYNSY